MSIYEVPDKAFITPNDLRKRYGSFDPNVFTRWQRQGRVEKVRNGLYRNVAHEIYSEVDAYALANQLYEPSYVSLHTALAYYALIPEYVVEVISVATKKTADFRIGTDRYRYRQIRSDYFFGYEDVPWKGSFYRIATPEKALIDMAYLEPNFSDPEWLEEMRFDHFGLREDVKWDYMMADAWAMDSIRVIQRLELLKRVYNI